jgi:hypothetical protein
METHFTERQLAIIRDINVQEQPKKLEPIVDNNRDNETIVEQKCKCEVNGSLK